MSTDHDAHCTHLNQLIDALPAPALPPGDATAPLGDVAPALVVHTLRQLHRQIPRAWVASLDRREVAMHATAVARLGDPPPSSAADLREVTAAGVRTVGLAMGWMAERVRDTGGAAAVVAAPATAAPAIDVFAAAANRRAAVRPSQVAWMGVLGCVALGAGVLYGYVTWLFHEPTKTSAPMPWQLTAGLLVSWLALSGGCVYGVVTAGRSARRERNRISAAAVLQYLASVSEARATAWLATRPEPTNLAGVIERYLTGEA